MPRTIRIALLLLIACAPLRAQDSNDRKGSASLRRDATEYLRKGMHAEAAQALEKAVAQDPSNVRLLMDYMWALWHSKRYPETLAVTNKLAGLTKDNIEVLNMLGRANEQLGNLDAARRAYARSIELKPQQLPVIRALGRLYYDAKDYRSSLRYYEQFIAQQPEDAAVHAAIGRIAFYQERYSDALQSYEKALELDPESARFKYGKAQALYFSGRVSDSIALLRELAQARPTDWGAVQFLTAAATVNKNLTLAYSTLEDNVREVGPQEEGVLLQLAELYRDTGQPELFRNTINRLISMNPQHGAALLDKAQFLLDNGSPKEAAVIYQKVARMNPGSIFARTGLAESASISSQTAKAAESIEAALALDPTDPDLILRKAALTYRNGDYAGAKGQLVKWLESNEEKTLPILLFHGIIQSVTDPALSAPTNISLATFEAQMRALKEAGYVSISVQQAVDWFRGKGSIPEKAVLLTFDDARLDSFVNADPVLKEMGFRAVMFAPIHNIAGNLPGFANWKEVASYVATGRWEVQAHGDKGHTYVPMDSSGRKGLFLPNKLWIDAEKRMETDAEWEARVRADHAGSKEKMAKFLGTTPTVFAWPEGDYGQFGIPNHGEAAAKNLKLCREAYTICFTQNEYGINVRGRDMARIFRWEPRDDTTGEQVLQRINDETTFIRMRRQLMMMATWEGRPQEANAWLRKNAEKITTKSVLLADEAVLHRDMGDYARGMAMARQAQALSSTPDTEKLVESMRQRVQPDWTGHFSNFADNQTRRDFIFRQSVGSFLLHGNLLRLALIHGEHHQEDLNSVTDNGLGLQLSRSLGLLHALEVQVDDHLYSGRSPNTLGASALIRSHWTDTMDTEFTGGSMPYEIASALAGNIQNRFAGVIATYKQRGSWKLQGKGKYTNHSNDVNSRYYGSGQLSHPIKQGSDLRLMGQASIEHVYRRSAFYYSPQHMRLYQMGLNYDGDIDKGLHIFASFLPGIGKESGQDFRFTQVYDVNVRWDYTPSVSIVPQFWVTDTPNYNATYFDIQVTYRFGGRNARTTE